MPRFVLLRHECPPDGPVPSHWDLMLECEGELRTWRLVQLPAEWASALGEGVAKVQELVAIERLADHRIDYLQYEGDLSGDRGSVERVDWGEYEAFEPPGDNSQFYLRGERICSLCTIADGMLTVS